MKIEIDLNDESSIAAAIKLGITTPQQVCEVMDDEGLYAEIVENCLVTENGWYADDGNFEVYYPDADSSADAAEEYVSTGDFGDGGSIDVATWRRGIDADGDIVRVDEWTHTIDVPQDHEALIGQAMGDAGCGLDPDDHEWTSEGEGGLKENPGVWSTGGTSMEFHSHCRRCGLIRVEHHTGSQRNPGEGDTTAYRKPNDDELAAYRACGAMDE